MIVNGTAKCSICDKEIYGTLQGFKHCTKCGKFVCSACQEEGCECGNDKFEDQWEKNEREHPGSRIVF